MATITAAGLGSNLDVNSLVTQLVQAEGATPTKRLDTREATLQAKLSAYGSFKSAVSQFQGSLSGLRTSSSLLARTATSSDSKVLTATTTSIAATGDHTLKVSQLAQSQRLASGSFAATTTTVGTGTLTFSFGTYDATAGTYTANPNKADVSLTIDSAHSSLEGIRDAVNQANAGVAANIVNDGSGYRLVLASSDSGAANSLKVTVADNAGGDTDTTGLSQLAYDPTAVVGTGKNLEQTQEGRDAKFEVDGIAMSRASNTVAEAIPGVTLSLLSESAAGSSIKLSVSTDKDGVAKQVNSFVEAFNTLQKTLSDLSKYDSTTKETGALFGDATLRNVSSQLRSMISEPVTGLTGNYQSLVNIGVKTQKDGTLSLDSSKLQTALDTDLPGVAALFTPRGKSTDPLVSYIGASSTAKIGTYGVTVTSLGSSGSYTGNELTDLPTIDSSNNSFALKIDGVQSGTIALTEKSYDSGADLATELQTRINADSVFKAAGSAVTVNYENGKLNIQSSRQGSTSTVEVTTANEVLGLAVGTGTPGEDAVQGTIGGVAATGAGQMLSGTGDAAGLRILVTGGALGNRGTMTFSRGVADQLYNFTTGLLGSKGLITAGTNGINTGITQLTKERTALQAKLDAADTRYRTQFTNLDSLITSMKSTGTFLTQQLSALSGTSSG